MSFCTQQYLINFLSDDILNVITQYFSLVGACIGTVGYGTALQDEKLPV
jgi:hypothetical protein